MRKLQIVSVALVVLAFLTAIYVQPQMPLRVASHWNAAGDVDGYMDRDFGTYFMPFLSLALLLLLFALPIIDPLKRNYSEFQKEYDGMVAIILGFMYYVYLLTVAINLGYSLNIMQWLAPGFGALFYYMGVMIGKARQNWFMGIRTPWTMSSERVWKKTHELGGKLFKAAGVIALLGIALPQFFIASIAVIIAAAIVTFVYSYLEFNKEKKGGAGKKGKKRK